MKEGALCRSGSSRCKGPEACLRNSKEASGVGANGVGVRPELWEDCDQRNNRGYRVALFVSFICVHKFSSRNIIFPFYKTVLSFATSRTSTGPNNS